MIDITDLPRSTPEFRMNDFRQLLPRLDLPRGLVNRSELYQASFRNCHWFRCTYDI